MTDVDLELRIGDWLKAEAGAWQAPGTLRRRVLDLPAQPPATDGWWHRFAGLPAFGGAVAAVGLAAVLVANSFFGLFDAPAGADGGPCNNRQVQRALDELRDADGYRYVSREERRALDPDAELDFDDPSFVWEVTWVSDGAHLAPDMAHDVPRSPEYAGMRGYLEHLQVGGHTYQLREIDGEPTWVEQENWPTANGVWGYLANLFPIFSIPGVNALAWDAAVPEDLPGEGGCVAATRLPSDSGPTGRIAALRVDTGSGRPVTTFIGPAVDARANEGDTRSAWEISWELPSPDEFVAPGDPRPDPNETGSEFTPPPTPTPIPVSEDAWAPTPLPLATALADARAVGSPSLVRGERWVAVAAAYGDDGSLPAIWTSDDGLSWDPVEDLGDMGDLSPQGIAWNGREYLLLGYRDHEVDGAWDSFRPESWTSDDGITWEPGGAIGPPVGSGEVANPNRPVAGGPGWVLGGSIFWQTDSGQEYRPAMFWSADGSEWTTVELADTRVGSVRSPVVMPDGSLLAYSCESPSSATTGSGDCYARPWRSTDGMTWEHGPVVQTEPWTIERWGDQLVTVVSDVSDDPESQTGGGRVMISDDGEAWEVLAELPSHEYAPGQVRVVDGTLYVDATTPTGDGTSRTVLWRLADDGTWSTIELAPADGFLSAWIGGVVRTDAGVVVFGSSYDGESGEERPLLWVEP